MRRVRVTKLQTNLHRHTTTISMQLFQWERLLTHVYQSLLCIGRTCFSMTSQVGTSQEVDASNYDVDIPSQSMCINVE